MGTNSIVMNTNIRRAVVFEDRICDKRDHPKCKEILDVSAMLERERGLKGEKNIPRFTTLLLEQTIRTNDVSFWKAAVDDIDTNDLDIHAANVIFEQHDVLPGLFIKCLTEARDVEHLVSMFRVFLEIAPHLSETTKTLFSKAISVQWKSFVNVLILYDRTDRKIKDGIYNCFSKFIDALDISKDSLILIMKEIVKNKKFEILSIFSRIDSNIYGDEIIEDLLLSAKNTTSTNRYGLVCLIAKIISEINVTVDVSPFVKTILDKTMQDRYVDSRTVKSLAFILEKTSTDPVFRNFASIVLWSSAVKHN